MSTMTSESSSNACRDVTVHTKNVPGQITYTLRGLTNGEVQSWAAFCASCFSYKPNPPPVEYFERHYYNDPSHEASLIRVAIDKNRKEIVSSVRIFVRDISIGADTCVAGGIGEVCTSPNHRQRGLSKMLLQDAIAVMAKRNMTMSLLHAAPAFFPVYQKVGYQNVTSHWSTIAVDVSKCIDESNKDITKSHSIRLADFPSDTTRLQALHKQYSELNFSGCIIRSSQYWIEYLSRELKGSLWVLVEEGDESRIVSWLSIRVKGEHHVVAEFGCDSTCTTTTSALSLLLPVTVGKEKGSVDLRLPTRVLNEIKEESLEKQTLDFVDWKTEKLDNDDGWMYRPLKNAPTMDMTEISSTRPHLIWPSDSF